MCFERYDSYWSSLYLYRYRLGKIELKEKLDRCLANNAWDSLFPISKVTNLPIIGSDHRPILVESKPQLLAAQKIFRFENIWTTSEDCEKLVSKVWSSTSSSEPLLLWLENLKACKHSLSVWSKKAFPRSLKQVDILLSRINVLHNSSLPNADALIRKLSKEIEDLWIIEEKFWHQRSRLTW